jgi:hypothetical protein
MPSSTPCRAADCDRPAYARGHCERHYRQLLRRGAVRPDTRPTTCAVESCGRRAVTRGWCHGHYLRWRRNGDVRAAVPLERPPQDDCRHDGCTKGAHSAGWCRAHARRVRLYGDPDAGRPARTRTPEGHLSHGYWRVRVPPEERHLTHGAAVELEHRLVVARVLGRPLTRDEAVHHLNGDRLDNRLENLELWSSAQPSGQRVADKVAHALALLRRYRPDLLREPRQHEGRRPHSDGGLST